jgi:transketolase
MMSTAVDAATKTSLATAANEARGIAMDSIAAAHSGHMGLPLGAAEIGAVLYGSQVTLRFVALPRALDGTKSSPKFSFR